MLEMADREKAGREIAGRVCGWLCIRQTVGSVAVHGWRRRRDVGQRHSRSVQLRLRRVQRRLSWRQGHHPKTPRHRQTVCVTAPAAAPVISNWCHAGEVLAPLRTAITAAITTDYLQQSYKQKKSLTSVQYSVSCIAYVRIEQSFNWKSGCATVKMLHDFVARWSCATKLHDKIASVTSVLTCSYAHKCAVLKSRSSRQNMCNSTYMWNWNSKIRFTCSEIWIENYVPLKWVCMHNILLKLISSFSTCRPIPIRCIFIVQRYSGAVFAVVVCLSVWCGCSAPAAEWLDSSAVDIAELAHVAGESILCREGWRRGSSKWLWRGLVICIVVVCECFCAWNCCRKRLTATQCLQHPWLKVRTVAYPERDRGRPPRPKSIYDI